ncbi:Alpha/beta hydrolase fold-1 precursor [Actinokineospora spheciospongiae]|uniref:Alpha/beta hydrolase fold-1 n=1 Tax=Actinokineospora spheciospongiae TaxID=909613 RepID=W7IVM8_9PSEU|nr:alpha/beta fold hydrolase [Actinokineospora spheciospongiae]EWC64423.1 Alpha/beta hydrolase fold-1 precursor [Actinokineospora spheciospongiae]
MREHDVLSADGTRVRGWHTDSTGPVVLLCPGLGTIPEAWPALLLPDSGVRVLSWYHRGTMGSDRPADESRITLADHVADALAVLDAAGVRRCVVMGWSMGVMVATELAQRYPDRVSGLMLAAGVPGDMFGALLGVAGVPRPLGRALGLLAAHAVKGLGPLVDAVLHRVPVNRATATLLQHTGFMLPGGAEADEVAEAVRRFLGHDSRWYVTLALALADVPERDLTGIGVPVTVLAGKYDVVADPRRALESVAGLPHARTRVVPTSHFMPLEAPEVIVAELGMLVRRVAAVERARADADPAALTPGSRPPA